MTPSHGQWRLGHFLSPGANSRGADSGLLRYQRPSGFVRHLFSQLVSLGGVVESAKLNGLEHLVETMAFPLDPMRGRIQPTKIWGC